jgi:hypothetical protein
LITPRLEPQKRAKLVEETTETLGGNDRLESAHGSVALFQPPMILLQLIKR